MPSSWGTFIRIKRTNRFGDYFHGTIRSPESVVKNRLMTFDNLLFEKKNSIAYVTVNRPKVLNALNMATMEELRAVFHDIKNDPSVRVVIFTGTGEKAFIAGADIAELAKHDAVKGKEYTHRGQS